MAADFTLKAHDRLPSISATLNVDLSPAGTVVKFIMLAANTDGTPKSGATPTVNSPAVVVSTGVSSVVRYDWAAADTATAGSYVAEWQATINGKPQTFPTGSYHTIAILADLDGA